MRRLSCRLIRVVGELMPLLLFAAVAHATTVTTFSPQGEVAQIRQMRATFSESMVPFGDLRQPDPFLIKCGQPGTGRWADDKTWIYDFKSDVPPGTKCSVSAKPGLKSVDGNALTGTASYSFNTGGPAVVRSYPQENLIEENQYFAFLLNGAADPKSVEAHAFCEASGISERIGVVVVEGPDRDAILKAVGLTPVANRSVVFHCKQALPPEADVTITFGAGIATLSGVASTAERHFKYSVQPAFSASFTCERENSHADCLPVRPMRIEFSSPIPRAMAEKIELTAADGKHPASFEHDRGKEVKGFLSFVQRGYRKGILFFGKSAGHADNDPSTETVSAVEFAPNFPEKSEITIDLPPGLADEAGRALSNASDFPIKTKTTSAPPIVKFATSTFGILELNAEPLLPVTVRAVENDLDISTKTIAPDPSVKPADPPQTPGTVRELRLTEDAEIIKWIGLAQRYQETDLERSGVERELGITLPPPPKPATPSDRTSKRYGTAEDLQAQQEQAKYLAKYVDTRSISLLTKQTNVTKVALPAKDKTDPRPFEVVGIPLKQAGFYLVEIQSAQLGNSLLLDARPMFVRTTTLVTNMSVHFKHGVVNSGVWVTTLDHAKPVTGARVQISDCNGQPVWNGVTDGAGFALVGIELQQPRYDSTCVEMGTPSAYFVSARKTDASGQEDMAFTWSSWMEGIEPWRFALASHPASSGQLVAHTVLDRTLFRAGETVSMKHYLRQLRLTRLVVADKALRPDTLTVTHIGSGQSFDFPVTWRNGVYAENKFNIPKDAKLGEYSIVLKVPGQNSYALDTGSFRVEEFRLPVLTGEIAPPKAPIVKPATIPLSLQVSYGNGGGAAGLAVRLSAVLHSAETPPGIAIDHYPGFQCPIQVDRWRTRLLCKRLRWRGQRRG
jgi:hypothetical protein